jgi:cyanophycinase
MVLLFSGAEASPRGHLLIIGGGDRTEEMMRSFVELAARHRSGKIVIFPMASSVPQEVGAEQAGEFKKAGAKSVEFYVLTREEALDERNLKILEDAGGVFFSGGVQSRLTDVLLNTPIQERLCQIYEEGGIIGGTSAGAAVMSEVMITGDEKRKVEEGHEFETIEAGNIVTTPGLGFVKTAIIDQHFVVRKRHNRLISVIAEHPSLLGVGIDEDTAILVERDTSFEVLGRTSVIVLDAEDSSIMATASGALRIIGMKIHVLVAGDRFDLKMRKAMLR